MPRRHWLMKSEPSTYGIHHLERDGTTSWEGVRNYQARNHMKEMKVRDGVIFYHSSAAPPGCAGVARVCREAHPDLTAQKTGSKYHDPKATKEKPIWEMVDIAFVEAFSDVVPLAELKETPGLEEMLVLRRGMRLSVQPMTKAEFDLIVKLGRRRS